MATILQITPHRVFPPRGGRRAFFYQRELAKHHNVHLLVPQAKSQMTGVREGYTMPKNVTVHSSIDDPAPKTPFSLLPSRLENALHHRWRRRSMKGPSSKDLLSTWHHLEHLLRTQPVDMVIFDHLQSLSMATIVQRISPRTIRMLNAHNVDYMLYERLAENEKDETEKAKIQQRAALSKTIEENLSGYVHGYWACSEDDHRELKRLNGDSVFGYAIPNGIASEVLPWDGRDDKRADKKVLFCGSLNYEPNRRGLHWFNEGPWPIIKERDPEARLIVVGYGAKETDFAELRADPRVDFIGEVDEVPPWYHKTSIAVAPILEGSGTRVKILEAMTLGNPVVSTIVGAEGIETADGDDILLRNAPDQFADAVVSLLNDQALYDRLKSHGRALVDKLYDWRVVGDALNDSVDDIFNRAGT